jgi:hypothetical protein
MKNNIGLGVVCIISSIGAYFFAPKSVLASTALTVGSPFSYNFTVDSSLSETSSAGSSSSGYWWVNSGAKLQMNGGRGQTVQGSLSATDPWRTLYANNNPLDTDNGYHPQNIFRLVGRSLWTDVRQQAYFKIMSNNFSTSPNRNQSNGLLLFNRYKGSQTLYYTGIRVDGYAVIKKKLNGVYSTLALVKAFPGTYDHDTSPNLMPKNTWLGLRSEVVDNANGTVSIKVYTDKNWTGNWTLVAEAVDDGVKYGPVISGSGFGGIRTDFMDVVFDQYKVEEL